MASHEGCCEWSCDKPATRKIYPYLDDDPGIYAVCDDDAHLPMGWRDVEEWEALT